MQKTAENRHSNWQLCFVEKISPKFVGNFSQCLASGSARSCPEPNSPAVNGPLTIFLWNGLTFVAYRCRTSSRGTMSRLSFTLSKALAGGRRARGRPGSREEVLARLLMKRAAARRAGLKELEAQLREQIVWSLPVQNPTDDAKDGCDEDALDHRL